MKKKIRHLSVMYPCWERNYSLVPDHHLAYWRGGPDQWISNTWLALLPPFSSFLSLSTDSFFFFSVQFAPCVNFDIGQKRQLLCGCSKMAVQVGKPAEELRSLGLGSTVINILGWSIRARARWLCTRCRTYWHLELVVLIVDQRRPWVVCEGARVHELCSGPRSFRGQWWLGFHGFGGAEA